MGCCASTPAVESRPQAHGQPVATAVTPTKASAPVELPGYGLRSISPAAPSSGFVSAGFRELFPLSFFQEALAVKQPQVFFLRGAQGSRF